MRHRGEELGLGLIEFLQLGVLLSELLPGVLGRVAGGVLGGQHPLPPLLQRLALRDVPEQPEIAAILALGEDRPVVGFERPAVREAELLALGLLAGRIQAGGPAQEFIRLGQGALDLVSHLGCRDPGQLLGGHLEAEQVAEALVDLRDLAVLVAHHDPRDRGGDQAVQAFGLVGQAAPGGPFRGQQPFSLSLGPLAGGHVNDRGEEAARQAMVVEQRDSRGLHPDLAAGGRDQAALGAQFNSPGRGERPFALHAHGVIRVQRRRPADPDGVRRGHLGQLAPAVVGEGAQAAGVHLHDADRGQLGEHPEAGLAVGQRIVSKLKVADVVDEGAEVHDTVDGERDRRCLGHALSAVGAHRRVPHLAGVHAAVA